MRKQEEERTFLRSDAPTAADTSGQIATTPFDARKLVRTEGIATLRRLTGKTEGAARSFMGKLLSAARDDCAAVLTALRECPDTRDSIAAVLAEDDRRRHLTLRDAEDRLRIRDLPSKGDRPVTPHEVAALDAMAENASIERARQAATPGSPAYRPARGDIRRGSGAAWHHRSGQPGRANVYHPRQRSAGTGEHMTRVIGRRITKMEAADLTDAGLLAIAEALNDRGVRTARGGDLAR